VTSEIAAGVGEGGLIFRQLTLRLGESELNWLGHQLLVTSEIAAGVGEGGLIFRQLTLRLGESELNWLG
ncbi:hypothetical protein C9420_28855, partial [Klebsiella pneumoniae]